MTTTELLKHPAVEAWGELGLGRIEPTGIELLKRTTKSQVYRIERVGQAGAVIAKRCEKETGTVERMIYEEVLPQLPGPSLSYYGCVDEPDEEFCWLFLEDAGEEDWLGADQYRTPAAKWVADLHLAAVTADLKARLPDRRPRHYLRQLHSARETLHDQLANPALDADGAAVLKSIVLQCEVVEAHWDEIEEFYRTMPRTLIHGDLVQENVHIRTRSQGVAFLPFDWEIAGWGVPATDLAQFTDQSISPEIPVNPDLPTYWSAVRESWPHLGFQEIRQLAELGTIFWLLANIDWERWSIIRGWMERGMRHMRAYQTGMAESLRAAGWGG